MSRTLDAFKQAILTALQTSAGTHPAMFHAFVDSALAALEDENRVYKTPAGLYCLMPQVENLVGSYLSLNPYSEIGSLSWQEEALQRALGMQWRKKLDEADSYVDTSWGRLYFERIGDVIHFTRLVVQEDRQ